MGNIIQMDGKRRSVDGKMLRMYIMSMREVVEYYYKLLAENKKQK